MKVLTKSRFKLGLECPNKLFYTQKKEYANTKELDPFLEALAQGGFQVEELARMHYPNGTLIEGDDGDYEYLWNRTLELLKKNVIIYEAAFLTDGLFIRTDILVKQGNKIELIEVKAKSFDPDDDNIFIGKREDTSNIYHVENKIKILTMLFMDFEKFQFDLNKKDVDDIEVKIIGIA